MVGKKGRENIMGCEGGGGCICALAHFIFRTNFFGLFPSLLRSVCVPEVFLSCHFVFLQTYSIHGD